MARSHVPAEVRTAPGRSRPMPCPTRSTAATYLPAASAGPAAERRPAAPGCRPRPDRQLLHRPRGRRLIDTVLAEVPRDRSGSGAPADDPTHVSPYMLYALARRYDEFPGDRGRRVVVARRIQGLASTWRLRGGVVGTRSKGQDLTTRRSCASARDVPLGAYYRVNSPGIDDMQSAITELHAIAVSAAIHEGWRTPQAYAKDGAKPICYHRPAGRQPPLGGHAFLSPATTTSASWSRTRGGRAGATTATRRCRTRTGSTTPTTPGSPGPASPDPVRPSSPMDRARRERRDLDGRPGPRPPAQSTSSTSRPAACPRPVARRSPARARSRTSCRDGPQPTAGPDTATRRDTSSCTPTAGWSTRTAASASPTG